VVNPRSSRKNLGVRALVEIEGEAKNGEHGNPSMTFLILNLQK
jgi:hypothetical protein